ncbi:hypothetical protein, partial [Plantactinospora mayteni]
AVAALAAATDIDELGCQQVWSKLTSGLHGLPIALSSPALMERLPAASWRPGHPAKIEKVLAGLDAPPITGPLPRRIRTEIW